MGLPWSATLYPQITSLPMTLALRVLGPDVCVLNPNQCVLSPAPMLRRVLPALRVLGRVNSLLWLPHHAAAAAGRAASTRHSCLITLRPGGAHAFPCSVCSICEQRLLSLLFYRQEETQGEAATRGRAGTASRTADCVQGFSSRPNSHSSYNQ